MKFQIDHDYHIHSKLSPCSNDETQTKENILKYAEENGLSEICITDHFWDEALPLERKFYIPQTFKHICEILPLPESEHVKFYFGCEAEMDAHMTLGLTKERMADFDFIIIPTTHLHMMGGPAESSTVESRAYLYVERLRKLLSMDLPFHKIGIAHLTCQLIAPNWKTDWDEHMRILDSIPDEVYEELFGQIAEKGAGFELNFTPANYSEADLPRVLRPYRIAKKVGCKFYLGSDAHNADDLQQAMSRFQDMVELLELSEADRFRFPIE